MLTFETSNSNKLITIQTHTIMNYSDFNHNQNYRFNQAQKLVLNGKQVDVSRQDIYKDIVDEMYSDYQLPELWLDESGFAKGNADNEDFDSLFERIKEIHFADYNNNIANLDRSEVDNDDILLFLDKMLMNKEKEAYDAVLAKYEDDTFQKLKEKYDIEVYGTSVYVNVNEEYDEDSFVEEAEELITLSQLYNELPNDVNIEFVEIEDKDRNNIRAIFHKK